jgi:hypothetical protein
MASPFVKQRERSRHISVATRLYFAFLPLSTTACLPDRQRIAIAYRSPNSAAGPSCSPLVSKTGKTDTGLRGRRDFPLNGPNIRSFDGESRNRDELMKQWVPNAEIIGIA